MGNGEWGMGNEGKEGAASADAPSSHSPFPIPHSPFLRSLVLADGDGRQGAADDLAEQLGGRRLAGEVLELQRRLADEQLDAGDRVAAALARLLDQQRLLRGVDGVENDQAGLEEAGVQGRLI